MRTVRLPVTNEFAISGKDAFIFAAFIFAL
jgi:hypothetical protein